MHILSALQPFGSAKNSQLVTISAALSSQQCLGRDDNRDVLGCHEGAVVRDASQDILARSFEGGANLPLVVRWSRRRSPACGPRRIRTVACVLPCAELRRVERHLAGATILYPDEPQPGC